MGLNLNEEVRDLTSIKIKSSNYLTEEREGARHVLLVEAVEEELKKIRQDLHQLLQVAQC